MVGFMNEEALDADAGNRLRHLLQPHPQQAVDEGRNLRQPAAGRRACSPTATTTRCSLKVKRLGDGNVCHTGERTCFYRTVTQKERRVVMKLKLGIPKGSLQDADRFSCSRRAGFNIYVSSRSYFPAIDDPEIECMLIRAQEMARYVADGVLDAGLTGQDWIAGARARRRQDRRDRADRRPDLRQAELRQGALGAGRAGGLVASSRPQDLDGKTVATELVRVTRALLPEARRQGQGRVLLGRDRSQAAGARRRHRRSHRNRIDAARQPPARLSTRSWNRTRSSSPTRRRSPTSGSGPSSKTSRCCSRRRSKRRAASG